MSDQTTIPDQKASTELVKSGVITEQQKAEIEKLPEPNTVRLTKLEQGLRTFVIVNPDGSESGQYHGRTPRQAALKAIKALPIVTTKDIPCTLRIRERGTKKIHIFSGYVAVEKAPMNRSKVD